MSKESIFRKVSLDRLASPEELDHQLMITSPVGWLALCAAGLLIAAGLVWGLFGCIADKTVGEGIIISSGGVISVASHTTGQITGVSVRDGDIVEKGDIIMRVEQTGLVNEINMLKQDLEIIRELNNGGQVGIDNLNYRLYGEISGIDRELKKARADVQIQKASYDYQIEQVNAEIDRLKLEVELAEIELSHAREYYQRLSGLVKNDNNYQSELDEADKRVKICELNFSAKQQALHRLETADDQYYLAQYNRSLESLEILEKQMADLLALKERELEEEITNRQNELLSDCQIISPVSGRILEVNVKKGDIVSVGRNVCSIVSSTEQTESLEAIVYVPVEPGKTIVPGMDVNISPTTIKKEEYGFMLGKVVSVSEYPVSMEGMMLALGNQELVKRLAGQSAPLEIRISLINDNNTVSGYKWSTPEGPPLSIDSGTLCISEVKTGRKRPIELVVPFLSRILPK